MNFNKLTKCSTQEYIYKNITFNVTSMTKCWFYISTTWFFFSKGKNIQMNDDIL